MNTQTTGDLANLACEGVKIGVETERERCAKIADQWLHVPTLLLRAGEMSLQERRTVLAVVSAISVAIRNPHDDNQ